MQYLFNVNYAWFFLCSTCDQERHRNIIFFAARSDKWHVVVFKCRKTNRDETKGYVMNIVSMQRDSREKYNSKSLK